MTLHVVECPEGWRQPGSFNYTGPYDPYAMEDAWAAWTSIAEEDPNAHDGEWPAFIRLPHEHVEWDGYGVPLFEGDVERQEWERRRRRR